MRVRPAIMSLASRVTPARFTRQNSGVWQSQGVSIPRGAILYYDADRSERKELARKGHDLESLVLGDQYEIQSDGSALNIGANVPIDTFGVEKWLRSCGAYTNLFSGDTSQARSVTLTAQAYTLQVFYAGTVACSYGTATVSTPLTFTATAGAVTFTPSGATLWMLTATSYPVPYTPPGTTMPATNATTTNGSWFKLPQYLDAETSDGLWKRDGVELVSSLDFTGWSINSEANSFIQNGKLNLVNTATYHVVAYKALLTVGARYKIKVIIDSISSGSIAFSILGSAATTPITVAGTYDVELSAATHTNLQLVGGTGTNAVISLISIQKLIPATKTSQVWAALDGEPDGVELLDVSGLSDSVQNNSDSDGVYNTVTRTLSNVAIGGDSSYPRFRFNMGEKVIGARYKCTVEFSNTSVGMGKVGDTVRLGNVGLTQALTKSGNVYSGVITADNTLSFIEILTNGTALWSMQIISATIQRIKPSPMTLATRVMMGVGSGDYTNNAVYNILAVSGTTNNILSNTKGAGGESRIVRSNDETTTAQFDNVAFSRNSIIRRITQVNTAGTQFRVGYMIEGTHTTIQWGSWVNFDSSFNPSTLCRLMLGFNNSYPMWFNKIVAWKKQASDTEIMEALS